MKKLGNFLASLNDESNFMFFLKQVSAVLIMAVVMGGLTFALYHSVLRAAAVGAFSGLIGLALANSGCGPVPNNVKISSCF